MTMLASEYKRDGSSQINNGHIENIEITPFESKKQSITDQPRFQKEKTSSENVFKTSFNNKASSGLGSRNPATPSPDKRTPLFMNGQESANFASTAHVTTQNYIIGTEDEND